MTVLQSVDYLLEDLSAQVFLQLPSLSHIVQQISSCTEFHYKDNVLVCLEGVKQLDYTLVSRFLKDQELLHHLLLGTLVL